MSRRKTVPTPDPDSQAPASGDPHAVDPPAEAAPEVGTPGNGSDTLVGRTLRDGILIREKLRETSVGTLYRAEDPNGLEVVVLVLPTASTDSVALALLRQRFRRAIDISHPNVASLHTVAETPDGLAYVVAECLSGELLSAILAKRGALSSGEALDIISQAAAGLQAAHEVRWVHGSISPETILLSQTAGGYPIVKLIGFSQALLLMGEAQPLEPDPLPEYSSPERLSGQQPDERSDVFSLGAVLYHMLTGVPLTTTTKDERIPGALQPAIDRALYPLPSGRFKTVADFAAALAVTQNAPALESPIVGVGASRALEYRSAAALVAIAAGLWLLGSNRQPAAAPLVLSASRESASVPAAEIQPRPPTPPPHASRPPAHSSGRRPATTARPDSASGPRVSPFRRAHPWVAVPGQRFYYRSSCPVALQSRDLLYFTNEDEARTAGYVPSDIPECR